VDREVGVLGLVDIRAHLVPLVVAHLFVHESPQVVAAGLRPRTLFLLHLELIQDPRLLIALILTLQNLIILLHQLADESATRLLVDARLALEVRILPHIVLYLCFVVATETALPGEHGVPLLGKLLSGLRGSHQLRVVIDHLLIRGQSLFLVWMTIFHAEPAFAVLLLDRVKVVLVLHPAITLDALELIQVVRRS